MSQLRWLFVPFWGGERQHGGETEPLWAWRGTPTTYRGGSRKLGFITEEYSGTYREKANGTPKTLQGRRNSSPARIHETSGGEEYRTQRDQSDKEAKAPASP